MVAQKPVEQVVQEHAEEWQRVPEVVTAGPSERDEKAVIRIFVSKLTPAVLEQLPEEQDGYPVIVEEAREPGQENPGQDVDIHPAE